MIFKIIIMIIPINKLKIFLYNNILGYQIDYSCKIGFSLIDCKYFIMKKDSRIGNFNMFIKCSNVEIEEGVFIGKFNKFKKIVVFLGKNSAVSKFNKFWNSDVAEYKGYKEIKIGNNTVINNSNEFDITDSITLGSNCVIGGKNSEFWTHGFDIWGNRIQGEVKIGDYCYIGSGCKFNLGVVIGDYNSIGFGSIVTKSILETNKLIGGNPAHIIKNLEINFEKYDCISKSEDGKCFYKKK